MERFTIQPGPIFQRRLEQARIPANQRSDYLKWVHWAANSAKSMALLGHSDIKTTMIYLQTVPTLTLKHAKSPLDLPASPNS